MEFRELETARLVLRKFNKRDLNFIFGHFREEFVSRYLYDNEPPENQEEAEKILDWCMDISSESHIRWCMVLKESKMQIGTAGFHNFNPANNSADIGYDLSENYTKKGYMTEALKCILNFGFEKYKLNRVQASVSVENSASNILLTKLGFKPEGVIRDQYLYKGKYYDHNLFSLLRSDNLY